MEYRRHGPPGTGKTESIRRDCAAAATKYGGGNVLVTSFTRAAAAEIKSRVNAIPEENAGTLHHFCRKALDGPAIATGKVVKGFNDANHQWGLSYDGQERDGWDRTRERPGDDALGAMDVLRARMVPREKWPSSIRDFAKAWDDFKAKTNMVDFTDLIERCLLDVDAAPGNPAVIFGDEVQDHTKMDVCLLRKWGAASQQLVLVGDPDQTIFTFRGADPDSLINPPLSDEFKRVLRQSYRVPHAVHALAARWISRVSLREPFDWAPRDAAGSVSSGPDWSNPKRVADLAIELEKKGTVLVQAACDYMLWPFIRELKDRGIPFCNPLRIEDHSWNPLLPPGKGKVGAAERVLAFLAGDWETHATEYRTWTKHDFWGWASTLALDGLFVRGSGEWIKSMKGIHETIDGSEVMEHFLPERREEVDRLNFANPESTLASLEWFRNNLGAKGKTCEFPIRVAQTRGGRALEDEPRIRIGTVHSYKGGEATSVILCPDVSFAGWKQWNGGQKERDSVIRLFYVAVTRAFENLVICKPGGPMHVRVA